MRYLVLAARLFIGGLFIYASVHKILDPAEFAQAIRNYLILPTAWTNIVAITLPWIEFVAGLLLILGIETAAAALIIFGMLTVFLPALFYAYFTGLDIACGCFSSAANSAGKITVLTLLRDSSILFIVLFILVADRGHFQLIGAGPAQTAARNS
ncbi:MAG: DoxX family membrane protein [Deltaproteobacteria bacterium]|nr:DoxX family membrane protein [Deltaproteobacteria bacterium]